jgi:hypothetical protein
MLARKSQLRHPSGIIIDTPLLIPSFSSKGLGVSYKRIPGRGEAEISEVSEVLRAASEFLTESMLISAYDIYYEYIQQPQHAITEITIVDSGGYETSDFHDLATTVIQRVHSKDWNESKHKEILLRWPQHIPAIFVSYDKATLRLPLNIQITNALNLFKDLPSHLSTILLKPETRDQKYVQIQNIVAHASDFNSFAVIGLTEKELGNSCLK